MKPADWVLEVLACSEPEWQLRGLSTSLKEVYADPALTEMCLDIATDLETEVAREPVDAGADINTVGDDYGGQQGLAMSPSH